jgi:hypothetical protein
MKSIVFREVEEVQCKEERGGVNHGQMWNFLTLSTGMRLWPLD